MATKKPQQTGIRTQAIVGETAAATRESLNRPLTPAEGGHAIPVSSGQVEKPKTKKG